MIQGYPYTVSLEFQDQHICGGAIVSANCIVTAAHCAGGPAPYLSVRAGTSFAGFGGSLHRVANITQHPEFRRNNQGLLINDLAVVCVQEAFPLDSSRKVLRLDASHVDTFKVNVSGWDVVDKDWPVQLQASLDTLERPGYCNEVYQDFGGLPKGQLCVSHGDENRRYCKGHAGDPMVWLSETLVGIASWNSDCTASRYPGVFMEISHYQAWISAQLKV